MTKISIMFHPLICLLRKPRTTLKNMRGVRQSNVLHTGYIFARYFWRDIALCLFAFFSYFSLMVFTFYSLKYRFIIAGLVALNQCRRCQYPQEIFGVLCLLRRKGGPLLLFCKDNPNNIAQVGDKRCSEFSRHERVEKCWNKYITTNMQSYINCS